MSGGIYAIWKTLAVTGPQTIGELGKSRQETGMLSQVTFPHQPAEYHQEMYVFCCRLLGKLMLGADGAPRVIHNVIRRSGLIWIDSR